MSGPTYPISPRPGVLPGFTRNQGWGLQTPMSSGSIMFVPIEVGSQLAMGLPRGWEGGPDVQGCDVRGPNHLGSVNSSGYITFAGIISWADEAFKITQNQRTFYD